MSHSFVVPACCLVMASAVTLFSIETSAQTDATAPVPEQPLEGAPSPTAAEPEFDAAAFSDDMGEVRLVVYSADPPQPLALVTVRVDRVNLGQTDENGVLFLDLYGGLYHVTFDISGDDTRTEAIRVIPNRAIEVLVEVPPHSTALLLKVNRSFGNASEDSTPPRDENNPLSAIEGTVLNEETKAPIADAHIFVQGLAAETKTDASGHFRMEVPVGRYEIVMVHPSFGTVTRSDLEVLPNQPTALVIETSPAREGLDEIVVSAPRMAGGAAALQQERKEAAQVSEIIGAEQVSKSGDSNAAAALKRVTGVTIVGGKYVYIRGLGERYSSTTLNGLNLPSPDPERRVVPLDMFPMEILESMKIQKTFSPEMQGDFGGGNVNLVTKGYPDEFLLKLEMAGGINVGGTFTKSDFTSDRGPTDLLGIDGGHRSLPGIVKRATEESPLVADSLVSDGYSAEELSTFTKAMPNNWGIDSKRIPPNFKIAATAGDGWKIKKTKLGFLTSLLYKNEWDVSDIKKREYAMDGDHLALQNEYFTRDADNAINLGGILTTGVDLSDSNRILLNTMVDRITDNDFYTYEAYHSDFDARVFNYEWIERMLISQQVIGSHTIKEAKELKIDWRYSYAMATSKEPDKRFVRYDYEDEARTIMAVSRESNANRRDYLFADDRVHDMGLDLALPFSQWTDEAGRVKTGGGITLKSRETDIRRFAYGKLNDVDDDALYSMPWDFFVDENEGPDGMRLIEITEGTDNYSGEQEVFAGYLSSDLPLGLGLSASGGLRLEKTFQEVATYAVFSDGKDRIESKIDTLDLLPALVLTYEIRKNMLIRLGYGKTVNRPDFREMSPGCAMGYAGAMRICGAPEEVENPDRTADSPDSVPATIPYTLNRAVIHNVDARWEWYFSDDESVSFGAFYKQLIEPIELVFRASTEKVAELRNAEGARNLGVELDFKKNFEFIHKAVRDFFIAGNATWIYSQIVMSHSSLLLQTNRKRPLQGQSPYVVNAQFGYDNVDLGLSAVLLFNVFGERIATVGVSGLPDIYEQPFYQLDVVIRKTLQKGFQLGIKAENLIDLQTEFTQGSETTEIYKKGREFTLSVSWTY